MKKIIVLGAITSVLALLMFEQCSPVPAPEGGPGSTLPAVIAPDSWFVNPVTIAPDDYGQFLNTNTHDSVFHLWAWQKFLSYTRSESAKAPFEDLVQVDNYLNPLGATLTLLDSTQAVSDGVLYAKDNSAVYYTIHVNRQMYDFQTTYLPRFRDTLSLYGDSTAHIHDSLVQIALHNAGYDTLNYPVGCVEIKTSWILVSALSDPGNYYVTTANITTAAGTSTQRVAMLGMHITGRVANHPEFIWATFEHDGLAPDFPWAHSAVQDTLNTIPSQQDFVFYNGGTPVVDCPMDNGPHSPTGFTNVFNMFPLGMARAFVSDSIPSSLDSSDNYYLASLNESVNTKLKGVSGPWQHYIYKGSVWLNYPNTVFGPGNANLYLLTDTALRGSRALSNITMETFTQLDYVHNYQYGSLNCFGCHSTADFTNVADSNDMLSYNLVLSHLFRNALGLKDAAERIDNSSMKSKR